MVEHGRIGKAKRWDTGRSSWNSWRRAKDETGTGTASEVSDMIRFREWNTPVEKGKNNMWAVPRTASTASMKPVTATGGRSPMVHSEKKISAW